ncbi:hypothetical protein AN651_14145 [Xanthomonas arboricola]|nr:hypothetical protein AN651_14145 [Xanthomonas arboricola]
MSRLLGDRYLASPPAFETTDAICEHLAFALTHLSNCFLAQIYALPVSFSKDRRCLLLMMGPAAIVSG